MFKYSGAGKVATLQANGRYVVDVVQVGQFQLGQMAGMVMRISYWVSHLERSRAEAMQVGMPDPLM